MQAAERLVGNQGEAVLDESSAADSGIRTADDSIMNDMVSYKSPARRVSTDSVSKFDSTQHGHLDLPMNAFAASWTLQIEGNRINHNGQYGDKIPSSKRLIPLCR